MSVWSTDRMPADNSEASDAAQRKGFVTRYNYVGTGQGTVIRITEFAPGAPRFMHRTETVDYALLLSGACPTNSTADLPGCILSRERSSKEDRHGYRSKAHRHRARRKRQGRDQDRRAAPGCQPIGPPADRRMRDLELDSGEVAHLKPGDVVVQRGTMHAWVNHGPAPCVFAFILIDANPPTVAGQALRTHFPAP